MITFQLASNISQFDVEIAITVIKIISKKLDTPLKGEEISFFFELSK